MGGGGWPVLDRLNFALACPGLFCITLWGGSSTSRVLGLEVLVAADAPQLQGFAEVPLVKGWEVRTPRPQGE